MKCHGKASLIFTSLSILYLLSLIPSPAISQNIYPAKAQPAPQRVQLEIPPGWTVFQGQNGLIVPHPVGWKIQDRGSGAFVAFRPGPDGGATLVLYVQPIAKIEGKASGVVQGLGQIAPEVFPGARVTKTRVVSNRPDVAVAEFSFSPRGAAFMGLSMCFKEDPQGVLYAIASTPNIWQREEPVMKQILGRFFYSAPRGQPGDASVPPMVLWRDPLEGAFSCPVPRGWKVEGGMRRFAGFDTRPEVLTVSPDNRILIRLGDAFIPFTMSIPTPLGLQYGFYEGQWQTGLGGTQMLTLRYLPSTAFLTDFYLPQRVGQVTNVRTRDLPEISRQVMAQMAGLRVRIDTGEVTFDTQGEMGSRKGYGFIQTQLTPSGAAAAGGGLWSVPAFYGYLSEPGEEHLAQTLLNRMVAGYQKNPNWEEQQRQALVGTYQIARRSQQDTFDIINRTFENRSRAQDHTFQNWSRAYRGEVLIQDPTTGEKFEVPSGSNYYFRVGSGNQFIGTETVTSPYSPRHWLQEMRIVK
jgi:hypothetical protein